MANNLTTFATTKFVNNNKNQIDTLNELTAATQKLTALEKYNNEELKELRLRSEITIYNKRVELARKAQEDAIELNKELQNKFLENQIATDKESKNALLANLKAAHKQKIKDLETFYGKNTKEFKRALDDENAAYKGAREKTRKQDLKAAKKHLDEVAAYQRKVDEQQNKVKKANEKKEDLKKAKEYAKSQHGDNIYSRLTGKYKNAAVDSLMATGNYENRAEAEKAYKESELAEKFGAVANKLADWSKQLESTIDEIGAIQGKMSTRLQGTDKLGTDLTEAVNTIVAVSPYVKQSDVVKNLSDYVGKGIAFNVEQRAFLATIKDKIADTFNAADSSLLRLVRIQQQDSTAARLGMESTMNAFLNNMYATSEYLAGVADNVRSNLQEAEALMGANAATEFEYQVQKWIGALYSVGMSSEAVGSISSTLGKLASGDISGVTSGGTSNLLIMAANQAGISISDILNSGLNANNTNALMSALASYMSSLYNGSNGSKVLQQQYANVFGVKASDLKAATNLAATMNIVKNTNATNDDMLNRLAYMANSMGSRTSTGEMLSNVMDNLKYGIASSIAQTPLLYGIYKAGTLMDSLFGGLEFSLPMVMGTGLFQTFKTSDLLRIGAFLGGTLGNIIDIGHSLANGSGAGTSGTGMISAFGSIATKVHKSDDTMSVNGAMITNSNSSDMIDSIQTEKTDMAKGTIIEAEEENTEATTTTIDEHIVNIYNVLQDTIKGTSVFNVKVLDYGLTGWN